MKYFLIVIFMPFIVNANNSVVVSVSKNVYKLNNDVSIELSDNKPYLGKKIKFRKIYSNETDFPIESNGSLMEDWKSVKEVFEIELEGPQPKAEVKISIFSPGAKNAESRNIKIPFIVVYMEGDWITSEALDSNIDDKDIISANLPVTAFQSVNDPKKVVCRFRIGIRKGEGIRTLKKPPTA